MLGWEIAFFILALSADAGPQCNTGSVYFVHQLEPADDSNIVPVRADIPTRRPSPFQCQSGRPLAPYNPEHRNRR